MEGNTEILDNFEEVRLERPLKVGDEVIIDRYVLSLVDTNELRVWRLRKKSIDWFLHVLLGIAFAVTMVYLITTELEKEAPSWMFMMLLGAVCMASLAYSIYIPYRNFSKKAAWVFTENGVVITTDFGKERRIPRSEIVRVQVYKMLVHVNGLEQHYTFDIRLHLNTILSSSGQLFSVGGSSEYLNKVDYYNNAVEIEQTEKNALQIAGTIQSFLRLT